MLMVYTTEVCTAFTNSITAVWSLPLQRTFKAKKKINL